MKILADTSLFSGTDVEDAFLQPLPLADVPNRARDEHAFLGLERAQADFHRKFAPISMHTIEFEACPHGADPGFRKKISSMAGMFAAETLWDQDFNGLSQEFLPLVAEQLFHLRVNQYDVAFSINDHDGIGRSFEETSELCFRSLPMSDIDSGYDHIRRRLLGTWQDRSRPGDQSMPSVTADAQSFVFGSGQVVASFKERRSKALTFFAVQEQIPWALALHVLHGITRELLAGAIPPDDPAFSVHHQDEGTHRIKDCRGNISFRL